MKQPFTFGLWASGSELRKQFQELEMELQLPCNGLENGFILRTYSQTALKYLYTEPWWSTSLTKLVIFLDRSCTIDADKLLCFPHLNELVMENKAELVNVHNLKSLRVLQARGGSLAHFLQHQELKLLHSTYARLGEAKYVVPDGLEELFIVSPEGDSCIVETKGMARIELSGFRKLKSAKVICRDGVIGHLSVEDYFPQEPVDLTECKQIDLLIISGCNHILPILVRSTFRGRVYQVNYKFTSLARPRFLKDVQSLDDLRVCEAAGFVTIVY